MLSFHYDMATAAPLVEPFLAWSHHPTSAALVEAQAQFAASVGAEKTVDTEAGERQLSQSCDWKDGVQGGPEPSCFHSSERVTPNLEKRLCECSGGSVQSSAVHVFAWFPGLLSPSLK